MGIRTVLHSHGCAYSFCEVRSLSSLASQRSLDQFEHLAAFDLLRRHQQYHIAGDLCLIQLLVLLEQSGTMNVASGPYLTASWTLPGSLDAEQPPLNLDSDAPVKEPVEAPLARVVELVLRHGLRQA